MAFHEAVLLCGGREFRVPKVRLMTLELFLGHSGLLDEPYEVKSTQDADIFDVFVRSLLGEEVEINVQNVRVLRDLCREFGDGDLMDSVNDYVVLHPEVGNSFRLDEVERKVEAQSRLLEMSRNEIRESVLAFSSFRMSFDERLTCLGRDLDEFRAQVINELRGELLCKIEEVRSELVSRIEGLESATAASLESLAHEISALKEGVTRDAVPGVLGGDLFVSRSFEYSGNKLDGILNCLGREHHGSVVKRGLVCLNGNPLHEDCGVIHSVSPWTCWRFASENKPNQTLCLDFKERRIIPSAYSIRSSAWERGRWHLKSWVIEVSEDGIDWKEIDRRDDNDELNDRLAVGVFEVRDKIESRYLRLRQTGKNHGGNDYLLLSSFEIFGVLREPISICNGARFAVFAGIDFEVGKDLFDGIFAELYRECGCKNIFDEGLVSVTGNGFDVEHSARCSTHATWNAFQSVNAPDQSICYDFKERRISTSSYSILTHATSRNGRHLKSWVIEVSSDGMTWTEIDRQDDNDVLNEAVAKANFKVKTRVQCRMLRLRQIGKNHAGNDQLVFYAMEIFGTLWGRN